ncbi:hypothetical protein ACA910_020964 [Epithemia clementina (nom. ined.)]
MCGQICWTRFWMCQRRLRRNLEFMKRAVDQNRLVLRYAVAKSAFCPTALRTLAAELASKAAMIMGGSRYSHGNAWANNLEHLLNGSQHNVKIVLEAGRHLFDNELF